MAIALFVLALFVLVLVHEFGHFIIAKLFGMRVDEFGIGFPPRLLGVQRGETTYTFNAVPLGGFVRIAGENGDDAETKHDPRSFTHKPKLAQAAVLVAGITANIIFGWILFSAAYMHGVETAVLPEQAGSSAELAVLSVVPNSPASRAGIAPNDRILKIENTAGEILNARLTPESASNFIAESAGGELTFTYRHGAEEKTATLSGEKGVAAVGEGRDDRVRIGVIMSLIEERSYPLPEALKIGFTETVTGLRDITIGVFGLLRDSFTLQADLKNVAGPIGIATLAGDASQFGFSAFLIFTAFISLNLAIINLLPLPALDGGRLVMVAIETVRGRAIKARTAGLVNTFGFLFLIGLMVLVTYNDIIRLFR